MRKSTVLKTVALIVGLALVVPAYAYIYTQQSNNVTQAIINKPNYYVKQLSNLDSSVDKGTHSNFTAQQFGPDSIYDTLTESNTGGSGAVTINQVTTYAADTSSASFSHSCAGSDRLLVVSVHVDTGKDISAVTYAGQSLTLVSQLVHTGGKPRVEVWRLIAPPVGSNTVIATVSGGADKVTVGAISYNGVNQTTPIDGVTSTQGYSTTASVTVTSQAGDLVQDAMAAISAGASTVGSGQTQRYNREMGGSGASNCYGAASTEPGATSVTMSWSLTESKEWVIVGFNINPGNANNYELDLEVQWTNVDFGEANEELCIYGGVMGSESLRVDVWTGSAWQNAVASLTAGWNNVTVSAYLVSSTFTVRFKGSIETSDLTQDSWAVDAVLLHVWT